MTAKMKPPASVVPLFGHAADEEDDAVLTTGTPLMMAQPSQARGIDLEGKPPVWFLLGTGGTGKTMFARWVGFRLAENGGAAHFGAFDPANRSLSHFIDNVTKPDGDELAQIAAKLRAVVAHHIRTPSPGMFDMGGGDLSLSSLLATAPDLVGSMQEGGVAPIAAYFLTPRVDDLVPLATFEQNGFQPPATVLILNRAKVPVGLDAASAFAPIRRHPAFRAALERGAIVLEMPMLNPPEVALEIERRRLSFGNGRDGTLPPNTKGSPISGLNRSSVRRWLEQMEVAFAPVSSWLP